MKKYRFLTLTFAVATILTGCSSNYNTYTTNTTAISNSAQNVTFTTNEDTSNSNMYNDEPLPLYSISIRIKEQLNELRTSLSLNDEELHKYLSGIEGGGAQEREDVELFLNLIDSLPLINFFEGKISWICYEAGFSRDTNEFSEHVYVTVEFNKDDWVRFEYQLSEDDSFINSEKSTNLQVFDVPICNDNDSIIVYSESIEKHPSERGSLITWDMKIEDVYTRLVYYTNSNKEIDIKAVIDNYKYETVNQNEYN